MGSAAFVPCYFWNVCHGGVNRFPGFEFAVLPSIVEILQLDSAQISLSRSSIENTTEEGAWRQRWASTSK